MLRFCSSAFLLVMIIPLLPQQPSNPEATNLHSQIQRIETALPKITDHGAALFLEAKLYARLGDLPKALALVKRGRRAGRRL